MAQGYTNDYSSTLTAAYFSGGGTLTVASSSGLPTSGLSFYLKVDGEYFLCTAYSGGSLTVTGARAGSSAANHSLGAQVTACWLLPEMIDGIRADQSQVGAYSSLPASGMRKGDRYKCTDSPLDLIYDGSSWQHFYAGHNVVAPPAVASLTWTNQGGAVAADQGGGLYVTIPANSGQNVRLLSSSYPSTPFTFTAAFVLNCLNINFFQTGIAVSDGTKVTSFNVTTATASSTNYFDLGVVNWATTGSAPTSLVFAEIPQPTVLYLTMTDDGSNIKFFYSTVPNDLQHIQLWTMGRTSFLTPNKLGAMFNVNNSTYPMSAWYHHWKVS